MTGLEKPIMQTDIRRPVCNSFSRTQLSVKRHFCLIKL